MELRRDRIVRASRDRRALATGPLLRAAVLASNAATIVLNDPRDEARDLDEAWVGTWEETFGEAEVIPPLPESADIKIGAGLATDNLHFVVGRDTTQQARAIVALAAKFLADPKCERLG